MLRISLRLTVSFFLFAVIGWPAMALANHHHIGGGGSGSGSGGGDPDADCLVWGYVVVDGGGADGAADAGDADAGDADAAVSDAGSGADAAQPTDAATSDAGSGPPAGAVLVCLQHATLFGCDCSTGPAAGAGWSRGVVGGVVGLFAAMLIASRRRRRRDASAGAGAGAGGGRR